MVGKESVQNACVQLDMVPMSPHLWGGSSSMDFGWCLGRIGHCLWVSLHFQSYYSGIYHQLTCHFGEMFEQKETWLWNEGTHWTAHNIVKLTKAQLLSQDCVQWPFCIRFLWACKFVQLKRGILLVMVPVAKKHIRYVMDMCSVTKLHSPEVKKVLWDHGVVTAYGRRACEAICLSIAVEWESSL